MAQNSFAQRFPGVKRVKLWVYVPRENVKEVREAMGRAGGGVIGNYSFCAFVVEGTGYFFPEEGANPAIGDVGKIEAVEEARIEIEVSVQKVSEVIEAIKAAHPYEEVPIDLLPLFEHGWFSQGN